MPYRVSKDITWDMAHRLVKGYRGKCNSLHGHTWAVRVTVEHATNPYALDEYGMVMDFNDFKPLKVWIDETLDHATALYKRDPLVGVLAAHEECRVLATDDNPTSEHLAALIARFCQEFLPEHIKLVSVEVNETCTSKAVFYAAS